MSMEHAKTTMDAFSIGTVIATIAGWLPSVSALLTVIWMLIRIIETATVQRLIKRFWP